jgi:hypothetical protein
VRYEGSHRTAAQGRRFGAQLREVLGMPRPGSAAADVTGAA